MIFFLFQRPKKKPIEQFFQDDADVIEGKDNILDDLITYLVLQYHNIIICFQNSDGLFYYYYKLEKGFRVYMLI